MTGFLDRLAEQRVLPVLRTATVDQAVAAAGTAVDAGLTVVELTATTPGWAEALAQVRRDRPDAVVGVGTVTSVETAQTALDGGAAFLVSPWPAADVRGPAREAGVVFVEGAFSPAEVAAGAARGPVKVFPAHVGGPTYLRSLRQVLPDAVLVPTGGIALADVPAWLAAGAHAVGVGSDLFAGDDDLATVLGKVLG
jgi:2-dehydro-3-deoxyphosphogluconate aldolase / (4S)-4-hydroxy-2-oxoglutarate aldolase